jgi:SAM-dependent methyltransferase
VLDLGCGDGTFLAMLMKEARAPAHGVGAEITDDLVNDCNDRLGDVPNLSFVSTSELDTAEHEHAYDGVFCMEVLEHVINEDSVLDQLRRLVAPSGKILLSVPVEIGFPLLVKQTARRVAGWMGVGDYPGTTPYSVRELLAGLFAGRSQHVERPVHIAENGEEFHDHKGFNWKLLREKLNAQFEIEQTTSSPISWLPPHLGSQCWFLIRPRP